MPIYNHKVITLTPTQFMKKNISRKLHIFTAFLSVTALLSCNVCAFADEIPEEQTEAAAESGTEETGTPLPTSPRRDVVEIDLPTVSESGETPFDFIVDPDHLVFETDAARYGGGRVEEGASILFRNHEGDYDFSGHSDSLKIRNRSNVPVKVTINARITDLGDTGLSSSRDFGDSESCELYLALTDDEGNEVPLRTDEDAAIETEMQKAPEDTYIYHVNEETGTVEYSLANESGETDFDTYAFGLTGACNTNADWENVSVCPSVTITWHVEPVLSENVGEIIKAPEQAEPETPENLQTEEGVQKEETEPVSQEQGSQQTGEEGSGTGETGGDTGTAPASEPSADPSPPPAPAGDDTGNAGNAEEPAPTSAPADVPDTGNTGGSSPGTDAQEPVSETGTAP